MDVSQFREIPVLDEDQWLILLGAGDDDPRALLDELLALFQEDVEERLHPLTEADPVRDREQIRQHAHSIAGSGSNLAARRLAAIARAIEAAEGYTPEEFSTVVKELLDTYAESVRVLQVRVNRI
ncbi:MAG: Hpt domain-containing protein [Opitutales bacterium]|nr:Hpt domain-containing protein [Opitutales bacterium]